MAFFGDVLTGDGDLFLGCFFLGILNGFLLLVSSLFLDSLSFFEDFFGFWYSPRIVGGGGGVVDLSLDVDVGLCLDVGLRLLVLLLLAAAKASGLRRCFSILGSFLSRPKIASSSLGSLSFFSTGGNADEADAGFLLDPLEVVT